MSSWTYINGTITVRPMGRTQPEKRYILETVLNHLPRVTGSEGDMNIYISFRKMVITVRVHVMNLAKRQII